MLAAVDYAAHIGKSLRTVQRYVEDGAQTIVPGAQMIDGQWWFPSDARPVKATSTGVAVTSQSPDAAPADVAVRSAERVDVVATTQGLPGGLTLEQVLERMPAFVDAATLARLLGVPVGVVRAHARELHGRRWGEDTAYVFPVRAVVRELAGLL